MNLKERLEALEAEAAKVGPVEDAKYKAWKEAEAKAKPFYDDWFQCRQALSQINARIEVLKGMISEGGQP